MFTKTYYLSVLTVTIGASTQFYSYGVVNQGQELMIEWINQTYRERLGTQLTDGQLNLFWAFVVSSVAVGAIPGALLTRTLAENFGRRNSLIYNGIINVIASLAELFARYFKSPELLIAGRLVLGANIGLSSSLVPMYLAEITPENYRGCVGTLHQIAVAFSEWLSLLLGLPEILGNDQRWPLAFSFPGLLALFLCIVLPFCAESPKYLLITCGRKQEAKESLLRLVKKYKANQMFDSLLTEAQGIKEEPGTYRELFSRREFRLPLAISLGMMFAQQFSGCSAVFAYSTDMFLNARLGPREAKLSTLGVGFAYFLCACTAPFLIRRVSRRLLAIFQLASVTCALTMLSIFTYWQNYEKSNLATYGTIFSLIFYMCVYGVGSPVPWMITSELFDTRFRPVGVTCSVFVAWLLCFLISTLYLPFKNLVGVSNSYIPFILMSMIFTVLMGHLLPDAKVISTTTKSTKPRRTRTESWVSNISVI